AGQAYQRLFLATALAHAGRHADAFAEADALAAMPEHRAWPRQLHLAEVCGWAAAAAGNDVTLAPDLRQQLAERYAARSVVLLAVVRAARAEAAWRQQISELLN